MATCDSDPKHGLDVDPRHGIATGIFCSPFSAWDAAGGSIESWLPGTPQTTGWDGPGKGISGRLFSRRARSAWKESSSNIGCPKQTSAWAWSPPKSSKAASADPSWLSESWVRDVKGSHSWPGIGGRDSIGSGQACWDKLRFSLKNNDILRAIRNQHVLIENQDVLCRFWFQWSRMMYAHVSTHIPTHKIKMTTHVVQGLEQISAKLKKTYYMKKINQPCTNSDHHI